MANHPSACIGSMPTEVLLKIIKFACEADEVSDERVNYPAGFMMLYTHICHSMALVDRRFNRLATPLLYTFLAPNEIGIDIQHPGVRLGHLHRTLKDNMSLRRLVRRIDLSVPSSNVFRDMDRWGSISDPYEDVKDILSWVPNMAFFGIFGDDPCSIRMWELIHLVLGNMKHLTCLSISADDGLEMTDIFKNIKGPCVIEKISIDHMPEAEAEAASEPGEESGKAQFKQLECVCYDGSWDQITRLLRWPQALHTFILRDCSYFWVEGEKCSSALIKALSIHKATLRRLDIGSLYAIQEQISDEAGISSLTALEELTIARGCLGFNALSFCNKMGFMLLPPSLRKFTLTFEVGGVEPTAALSDMGPDEEAWLVAFGTFAAVKERSNLNWIHVDFTPEPNIREGHSIGRMAAWPWDRLNSVAAKLAPHGIEVTYSKPNCTREEWQCAVTDRMEIGNPRAF